MNNHNQFISLREASNYLRYELYRENEVYIQDMNLITYVDMNLERIGVIEQNTRNNVINMILSGITKDNLILTINNNIR
tara:strand:+ start:128 stop:364 length:237 start_codon:yes stop_codon:yes gene_type:complete